MMRKKHLLLTTAVLGTVVGITDAIWATLLSFGVNPSNFVSSYIVMLTFAIIFVLFIVLASRKSVERPTNYQMMTGILYGIGNIIFLSVINAKGLIEIYSFLYISALVFVIIQIIYNKKRLRASTAAKFFMAALVAIAGLTGLFLSSNTINFGFIGGYGILLGVAMVFLYGVAPFFFSLEGTKTKNLGSSIFWVLVSELFVGLVLFPFGHYGAINLPIISVAGLLLGFFGSLQLLGYMFSKYGGRKSAIYSTIETILMNSDIILLTLIYIIVIGRVSLYQILSIAALFLGVFYVSNLEI